VASIEAGAERFRAIVLTSLTTFFGLLPIMFESSTQAQMILPMAVSLGFGILFSTVITLILVPALYNILADFINRKKAPLPLAPAV
jgi:multidrug efflux pump subunit AcrB